MTVQTDKLNRSFRTFIEQQKLFFVATAASDGRVNISPKGMESLKILDDQQIVWLSVSGSGNETAAHVLRNPRMTLMFCAFEGQPLILRVYGQAKVICPRHKKWQELSAHFPDYAGARNIFRLNIELVTTACGTGVPEMTFVRSRGETELLPFYQDMGAEGVNAYWRKKNMNSIDGFPAAIFADE